MPTNRIDASVSAADLQAIRDAIATIRQKLPFLVSLTVDERRATFKTGSDSLSFVTNAATAAQGNPDIFPASFDRQAFQRDFDLFGVLTALSTEIDSLAADVDDTRLATGGETMQQSIQVYDYVRSAAKTEPGLKAVAEQLAERFKKAGSPKAPAKPSA